MNETLNECEFTYMIFSQFLYWPIKSSFVVLIVFCFIYFPIVRQVINCSYLLLEKIKFLERLMLHFHLLLKEEMLLIIVSHLVDNF